MKKSIALLSLVFLFCLPVNALESLSPAIPFSLDEIIQEIHTPEALAHLMHLNFKFVEDSSLFGIDDYWQSPEEFWQLRAGDCEDYALLAQYVLTRLGYESYVVSIYDDRFYAHTIAVFKDKKGFQVMNEDHLYEYDSSSIEQAISLTYPGWTWSGIAELRNTRGWMVQKLSR